MRHFKPAEFQGYYDRYDPELLAFLDEYRDRRKASVRVSPAPGATGRTYGSGFHNVAIWGSVKAIDIMPSGMDTEADMRREVELLKQIKSDLGIAHIGIGIYPAWSPSPGIHLDVGNRGKASGIATWSGLPTGKDGGQEYKGIEEGFTYARQTQT